MKLNFKENKTVEIVTMKKNISYDVNDIDKIYIRFKFLFIKIYYLTIITNKYEKATYRFFSYNKESIKREVQKIKTHLHVKKMNQ